MAETKFEKFEKINSKIDIYIDEEEYDKVQELFIINDSGLLTKAFPDDGTCTAKLDEEWIDLLGSDKLPIKSINYQGFQKFNENNQLEPDWSRFFWAKLIRAKIQEKGTTCFFRRTDDVVAYLERNLPVITKDEKIKKQKFKLTVIYLLEMAACGTDVDGRSFAERARRFLKRYLKNGKNFGIFYDLLARYNCGVSYFHEARYRKAAREFNYIIWKKNEMSEKNGELKYFIGRHGIKLIYLPAFKYRADLQLKLQLSYHAVDTILSDMKLKSLSTNNKDEDHKYYEHRCDLIMAEAYLQMGNHEQSNKSLNKVKEYLEDVNDINKETKNCSIVTVKILSKINNLKCSNIYGRYLDLLLDEKLDKFEKSIKEDEDNSAGKSKENLEKDFMNLKDLFTYYESNVLDNSGDRIGYIEQISKFLILLLDIPEKYNKETIDYRKWADEIYVHNKGHFTESENDNNTGNTSSDDCPCKKKGIDLRRLGPEHYDEYCENIQKFYSKMRNYDANNNKINYKKDESDFLKRLKNLEKKDREDLLWRIRKLNIELNEKPYKYKFCKTCIGKKDNKPFQGLLHCVNKIGDNQNSANDFCLSSKDYEYIMDNWDEHFLDHLKYYSCHDDSIDRREPQYTLHFIGLQRWNSSSPAKGSSLGGGYLLYCADEKGCVKLGIAIDPGFDYIKNLFHEGFSLLDIDIVLLSHAHLDHIRDIESMVTLLLELKKRTNPGKKHKLHVIMTLGIYSRLEHIIRNLGSRDFVDTYIIDIKKEIKNNFLKTIQFVFHNNVCKTNNTDSITRFVVDTRNGNSNKQPIKVIIKPTRAYHDDFSQYSDSYGYTIQIEGEHKNLAYKFGYTGDTSWDKSIIDEYHDCDALLVHLGSLIDRNKKPNKFSDYGEPDKCFDLVKKKKHLYFVGMLHFLTELGNTKRKNKTLVLMSEFGEELHGKIRIDFVSRINDAFHKYGLYTLPVDVGLDVLLKKRENNEKGPWVKCALCDNYILITRENVGFETYGLDEGLFCVCTTCKKSVSTDVKIDKLRQLYEIGHEFRKCADDTIPPSAPIFTGTSPTNDTRPTWSWSIPAGAVNIRYQLDSESNEGWTVVGDTGVTTYTPETALSEGSHTLYAQAQDAAGTWSASGSYIITVEVKCDKGKGV